MSFCNSEYDIPFARSRCTVAFVAKSIRPTVLQSLCSSVPVRMVPLSVANCVDCVLARRFHSFQGGFLPLVFGVHYMKII